MSTPSRLVLAVKSVETVGASRRFSPCPLCNRGKNAFLVTRKASGWVYWCHRCHAKGFISSDGSTPRQARKLLTRVESPYVERANVTLPEDFTTEIPRAGQAWLGQYNLSPEVLDQSGIGYSPKLNRLIFPVRDGGKLIYWQGRSLDKKGEHTPPRPKYTNVTQAGAKPIYHIQINPTKPTVLVEDIISALKVADAGYNSIAILGSYVDDTLVLKLLKLNLTSAVIWLDPDKRQDMVKYQKRLMAFGIKTKSLPLTKKDPKDFSGSDIIDQIEGV